MANKLIKFERQGCAPCVAVTNFLEDEGVHYESVDVEENVDKAIDFKVMSTPITFLVDENETVLEFSRGFNQDELEEMISKL